MKTYRNALIVHWGMTSLVVLACATFGLQGCTHQPINWLSDPRLSQTDRLAAANEQYTAVLVTIRDARNSGLITQDSINRSLAPTLRGVSAALNGAQVAFAAGDDATVAEKLRAVANGLAAVQPLIPKGKP